MRTPSFRWWLPIVFWVFYAPSVSAAPSCIFAVAAPFNNYEIGTPGQIDTCFTSIATSSGTVTVGSDALPFPNDAVVSVDPTSTIQSINIPAATFLTFSVPSSYLLLNFGSVNSFNNLGIIDTASIIENHGSISVISNYGSLLASSSPILNQPSGTIGAINNYGTISVSGFNTAIYNGGTINSIFNSGTITGVTAIGTDGTIGTITNHGVLDGALEGIANNGLIGSIINYGTITAITNNGLVDSIVNYGTITSSLFQPNIGISNNFGTINYLKNASYITFSGNLPISYSAVINSPNSYGQLAVQSGTALGVMNFNVSSESRLAKGTYTNLLSGVTSANLDPASFSSIVGRYQWQLIDPNGDLSWDLVVTWLGPTVENTLASLQANQVSIDSLLAVRSAAMFNMLDYDCKGFGENNLCVSFQARYTGVNSQSEGAGVLTAAYRISPSLRVGAFIDYRATDNTQAGLKTSNNSPSFGAFAGFSSSPDGIGLQGRISAAYNTGNISITRSIFADTEPGYGKTNLTSFGAAAEVGWGFAIIPTMVATPFIGLRYTDVGRGSYVEAAVSNSVEFPLSYAAYGQRLTTGIAGMRLIGALSDRFTYQVGLGIEYDIVQNSSDYSGTSAIADLAVFSLQSMASPNRTRGFGGLGIAYGIDQNQKLTGNVIVRGQPYAAQPSITTLVGYQIGF